MTTLYTARITYSGLDRLDTTVKSADTPLGKALAPVWAMVMSHKDGTLTDSDYTEHYYTLLRRRYTANPSLFQSSFNNPELTLLCYCKVGVFCHRHLAKDILTKIGIANGLAVIDGGER